ncbi:MAG: MBL fold metallo-hydrolase [Desulfobacterales bacterium]
MEDITDVILTHLHFDHAGGSTVDSDGAVSPCFLNAVYYVQQDQWDGCQSLCSGPVQLSAGKLYAASDHGVLRILDGPAEEFFDGIDHCYPRPYPGPAASVD